MQYHGCAQQYHYIIILVGEQGYMSFFTLITSTI